MHYMLLLSLNAQNAASGKRALNNLQSRVDTAAKPLWFDSAHSGIAFTSDMPAIDIWKSLFSKEEDVESFRDVLIMEIGPDWMARRDTTCANWLATHLPPPRASMRRR